MRDDFDALIAERFAVLVDVPAPDTWSRVQSKFLDPTMVAVTEKESTLIDLEAPRRTREHHKVRPLIVALISVAAVASLIGALLMIDGPDDPDRSHPVDSSPGTLPASTIDTIPGSEFLEVPPDQIAVIREFVDAVNAGDTDAFLSAFDPDGGFDPRGVFAESSMEGLFPLQQIAEEPLVRAWMSMVNSWDLEIELTSCRPRVPDDDGGLLLRMVENEDGFVVCEVRTRWHKLSLELAEEWQFNLLGEKLTWFGHWGSTPLVDLNPEPRQLPLGYDDLEAWEGWLERTNPEAAARYLNPRGADEMCNADCVANLSPGNPELALRMTNLWAYTENDWVIDGHRFRPKGVIPYDPRWADEIEASIQDYLAEQPVPGA